MVFYGSAHRHPVNVRIHCVFVPIVLAGALMPFSWLHVGGLSLIWPVCASILIFYATLNRTAALSLAPLMLATAFGLDILEDHLGTAGRIGAALGAFFGGYALLFVGHAVEGRKPALFDDVWLSQVSAPLFVGAEFGRLFGLNRESFTKMEAEIARQDAQRATNSSSSTSAAST